ncbi:hypothetical protein [Lysinibacillus sphaericus]|uniref:Uncharacterized protein n=1 Tax=Lysinibacillus sphaericus OT4b.31 TaxID=1285586 RepID=R7ZDZ9_LYSSH|nr:hypothetical protein [Lysinibacillus sphaericus]EON72239.1 hypothetical protein H131_11708 [Lysinibacillus sphaericus OT4b.31]
MRDKLKKHLNKDMSFYAKFKNYGIRNIQMETKKRNLKVSKVERVLLHDLYDIDGDFMCDHIWVSNSSLFKDQNVKDGDIVQFKAIVDSYIKGYLGKKDDKNTVIKLDYGLNHVREVKIYQGNLNID